MGQMFPPGPAAPAASGFYVPTMPRAYYPNNMQQIRPQPRWPSQQQVRGPAQPGAGKDSHHELHLDMRLGFGFEEDTLCNYMTMCL